MHRKHLWQLDVVAECRPFLAEASGLVWTLAGEDEDGVPVYARVGHLRELSRSDVPGLGLELGVVAADWEDARRRAGEGRAEQLMSYAEGLRR